MAFVMKLTPEEKIKKAIIELQATHPFFAHISLALRLRAAPKGEHEKYGLPCETMGVNAAGRLTFSEPFVENIGPEEMRGLLCHETLHLVLEHIGRAGHRQKEIANIAMDMVVNMMVKQNNLKLPEGGIEVNTYNDTAILEYKTQDGKQKKVIIKDVSERWWEDIYDELYQQLDKDGMIEQVSAWGEGRGGDFHDHEGEGMSPQEVQEAREKWKERVAEAATIAKQKGLSPQGMERIVDRLLQPRVAWKSLLRKYIKPYLDPYDYSYAKPNKKSALLNVYLPNTLKESREVEIIADTSGSIGSEDLTTFVSEMVGIAKSAGQMKMTISFVDAQVYEEGRYHITGANIGKIMAMKPTGGGGTSLEIGVKYIKEHNPKVPVVVIFTDGCDTYNMSRKDMPFDVIWCITKSGVDIHNWDNGPSYGVRVKMQ